MNSSTGDVINPRRALEDSVQILMQHFGDAATGFSLEGNCGNIAVISTKGGARATLQASHTGGMKSTIYFNGSDREALYILQAYAAQHGLIVVPVSETQQIGLQTLPPQDTRIGYSSDSVWSELGAIINEKDRPYR